MFELTPIIKHAMSYDPFKEFGTMERRLFGENAFRTDIKDVGDAFVIEAELPGFKKEDVDVSIEDDVLTVTASHEETKEEKDGAGNYLRRERRSGSFTRSFDISEVDADGITGALDNGVLTLTLPKKKSATAPVKKVELQ